jgi:hypothetical protein
VRGLEVIGCGAEDTDRGIDGAVCVVGAALKALFRRIVVDGAGVDDETSGAAVFGVATLRLISLRIPFRIEAAEFGIGVVTAGFWVVPAAEPTTRSERLPPKRCSNDCCIGGVPCVTPVAVREALAGVEGGEAGSGVGAGVGVRTGVALGRLFRVHEFPGAFAKEFPLREKFAGVTVPGLLLLATFPSGSEGRTITESPPGLRSKRSRVPMRPAA